MYNNGRIITNLCSKCLCLGPRNSLWSPAVFGSHRIWSTPCATPGHTVNSEEMLGHARMSLVARVTHVITMLHVVITYIYGDHSSLLMWETFIGYLYNIFQDLVRHNASLSQGSCCNLSIWSIACDSPTAQRKLSYFVWLCYLGIYGYNYGT